MKKIGFIDYYLDEFHANHYVDWIKEASNGELEVAYAWAKKDAPSGMTTKEWCEQYHVQQVGTMEELTEFSDFIIVLSPDHSEMHEELCRVPLSSGKRVYVDKTFAPDAAAAKRIFAAAEEHGTPCFSSSALRFAAEYQNIDRSRVRNIASWGPGTYETYSIHQIEPIVSLMGAEAKRVLYIGTEDWPALVIEFSGNRRAVMSHHGWSCPFVMTVNFEDATSNTVQVESDYYQRFIKEMADFFLNGEVKVAHAETVAVIAIREAGAKAARTPGIWVNVE
jgi:Predicted dehydrogenases and related proteins